MNNKDKWLIGVDLDGTLLRGEKFNENYSVSKYTQKVLKEMYNQGHYVCITTGRGVVGTTKVYESINLPNPVINNAGAHINNPLDENFKPIISSIDHEQIGEIIYNDKYSFEIKGVSIDTTYKSIWQSEPELNILKDELVKSGARIFFENTTYIDDYDIVSLNIIYDVEDINKVIKHLEDKFGEELHIVNWISSTAKKLGYKGVEINLKKMSKGKALIRLAKKLNIPLENTMGIGDSENDRELMTVPKVGIAMKNAIQEIKDLSTEITEFTNEEEGVAKFLVKKFNLNL